MPTPKSKQYGARPVNSSHLFLLVGAAICILVQAQPSWKRHWSFEKLLQQARKRVSFRFQSALSHTWNYLMHVKSEKPLLLVYWRRAKSYTLRFAVLAESRTGHNQNGILRFVYCHSGLLPSNWLEAAYGEWIKLPTWRKSWNWESTFSLRLSCGMQLFCTQNRTH